MYTILFPNEHFVYLVEANHPLIDVEVEKLAWLLQCSPQPVATITGNFIGPRREMITPWSTNAVEIAVNVGIEGLTRIECFRCYLGTAEFDPMLEAVYDRLDNKTLRVNQEPEPVRQIADIASYSQAAGLAFSGDEISYLEAISNQLGRSLTDCELFAFGQINSEHCRHKIFNGKFIIDGVEQESSLFELIKATSRTAPARIISAYKDNVAFVDGPPVIQFAPLGAAEASFFAEEEVDVVLAIKAETHNFPTAVEPFNGASTGSGGEIRDRMAGGKGSLPLAGTAVYMTSYPRLSPADEGGRKLVAAERRWKYQSPRQILIKASNGASDFGNKFGQPLINGSLLTFEGYCNVNGVRQLYGYDRTVMLAGGIGCAKRAQALKSNPQPGDKVLVLGGDNYRIGMAGGSVSSVATGEYAEELELSAVQRANPEMQKRVYNVIRALVESSRNPIRLIHDHGAGGHINCLSELLEATGGKVEIARLPVGDPTLSVREILCNESQERMGLIVAAEDVPLLEKLARRERAPLYVVGEAAGDGVICFEDNWGSRPFELTTDMLFGSSPKTIITSETPIIDAGVVPVEISNEEEFWVCFQAVLGLEGVGSKDWLTNKVDRSVTGRIALQQTCGRLQLPLNNLGVVALDYSGESGVATAVGHASLIGLSDPKAGAILSVAEALTNIVWAPLRGKMEAVALSANWMWPAKQPGEDARLYSAVQAASSFCQDVGIAIPTGKDSLSMTMNYSDGTVVRAPGTVVITAAAEVVDCKRCVSVDLKPVEHSSIIYVDLSGVEGAPLGGSAYAQTQGVVGSEVPTVIDPLKFKTGFGVIQELILSGKVLAGHDVSAGGLVVCLAEMAMAGGVGVSLHSLGAKNDRIAQLFCEKPGVLLQVFDVDSDEISDCFSAHGIRAENIAKVGGEDLVIANRDFTFTKAVNDILSIWYQPSASLELYQCAKEQADERRRTYGHHPLTFKFPAEFRGTWAAEGLSARRSGRSGIVGAIIREKGTNGDREMAYALHAAGFDVKDITMWDLMTGAERLKDVNLAVFPGGFSNSDVLGAARGWAGVFRYNERARRVLEAFFSREDTLSLGVCNGCQLMMELGLLYPRNIKQPRMARNLSGKFESSFLGVSVPESPSILLKGLAGSQMGIWVAHGEGRFVLPEDEASYQIALCYAHSSYPANPNGSERDVAGLCSFDGRHLAMMPHLERSIFPWQWGWYPHTWQHEITPWLTAFKAGIDWIKERS